MPLAYGAREVAHCSPSPRTRGDRSARDVCREHDIAETLYYGWRGKLLRVARRCSPARRSATQSAKLRKKVAQLERKTYELEVAGEALRGWE